MKTSLNTLRARAARGFLPERWRLLISKWEMEEFVCEMSVVANANWSGWLVAGVSGRVKNSYVYEN